MYLLSVLCTQVKTVQTGLKPVLQLGQVTELKKTVNLDTPVYTKYVKVVGDEAGANFGSAAMIEFYERLNSDNYDINKDNSVDNKDVALLLKHVIGIDTSSDISFENADFNGDGNVDMLDVSLLKLTLIIT